MKRWALFGISFVAHAGLAVGLGRIQRPIARAATAISISETTKRKPAPPKPVDQPPPMDKDPAPRSAQRAKAAAVDTKVEAKTSEPPPSSGDGALDGIADFGLSLSGATGGPGLGVPIGQSRAPSRFAPVEKVVRRPQTALTKADACEETASKPKPKVVPTPAYTETGRAAGVEGKVRVEVTVDEQGRVVAVRVLQGLGYGLDEAALDAARRATFEPATRCGKPVAATFNIGMRFSI